MTITQPLTTTNHLKYSQLFRETIEILYLQSTVLLMFIDKMGLKINKELDGSNNKILHKLLIVMNIMFIKMIQEVLLVPLQLETNIQK